MDYEDRLGERDLRRARHDFRAEVEELEYVAAEMAASERGLIDAVVDAGMDGHVVTVDLPQCQVAGLVTHAGQSVFTVLAVSGIPTLIMIRHVLGIRLSPDRSASARVVRGHPLSLIASLRGSASDGAPISIERVAGGSIAGVVEAVSESHVQLADSSQARWHVPLAAIAAIRPDSR